jgi:hypothetical protein
VRLRDADRGDLPRIVALLADDDLDHRRESHQVPTVIGASAILVGR